MHFTFCNGLESLEFLRTPTYVLVTVLEGCSVLLFYSEFCHQKCFGTKGQKITIQGGKEWTWTRPFARPRPSSTSDEGGSAVPNSRLITAVIWISRTPMADAGGLSALGSTQTTKTVIKRPPLRSAMRQRQGHRETKRAPRGLWNGRRVEGDGVFGAQ